MSDEAKADQFYQRNTMAARSGCCGTWRKPCPYHDGYMTGLEVGLDAAAGLLVDDDTARLRKLGEAVEELPRGEGQYGLLGFVERRAGWNDCLDAIYREAGIDQ